MRINLDKKKVLIASLITALFLAAIISTFWPKGDKPEKIFEANFSYPKLLDQTIRFYDSENKTISALDLNSQIVSNLTKIDFQKVYNILWSPSGDEAIITSEGNDEFSDALWYLSFIKNSLSPLDAKIVKVIWSPKGDKIAYLRQDGESSLNIANPDGSNWKNVFSFGEDFEFGDTSLSWSPDGKQIVIASGGTDVGPTETFIIDISSGEKTILTNEPTGSIGAWSPDSKKILFEIYSENSESSVWAYKNLSDNQTINLDFEGSLYWLSDSKTLIGTNQEAIYKIDSDSKKKQIIFKPKDPMFFDYLLPDVEGKTLYFISEKTLYRLKIK